MKPFQLVLLLIVANIAAVPEANSEEGVLSCKWTGTSYICVVPTSNSPDNSPEPGSPSPKPVCGVKFSCGGGPAPGSKFIEVPDTMLLSWKDDKSSVFVVFPESTGAESTESMRRMLEGFRLQIESYRIDSDSSGNFLSDGKFDQYKLGIDAYKNSMKAILPSAQ